MTKHLHFLRHLMCLMVLAIPALAMAQGGTSYDNVSATFAWPMGSDKEPTATESVADAVSKMSFMAGTDLTVTTATNIAANNGVKMTLFAPGTSKVGNVPSVMIEYTVKVKKGITLTLNSFSADIVKKGTDDVAIGWSYTVDGTESTISDIAKDAILRDNSANASTATLGHSYDITASAGQEVSLRIYISQVNSGKNVCLSNVKLNATVNGAPIERTFKDFAINMVRRTIEESEIPEGVTITGKARGDDHGYDNFVAVVPVDGPVQLTLGGCQYAGTNATVKNQAGDVIATIDVKTPGCYHNGGTATWVYNSEEPEVLTIIGGQYTPYIAMKACDLIPMCNVTYYDIDGKTVIGKEEVEGNSPLAYKYGESDVTVDAGKAFRGWFNSTLASATKVAEGTAVQKDLELYAKTSEIENPTTTSRYVYNLNAANFYMEDHEAISVTNAKFNDAQHGYVFQNGSTLSLKVAGKAYVSIGNCKYSGGSSKATVTDGAGNTVTEFDCYAASDGAETTFFYDGDATTLTITFNGTSYVHKVSVYNVIDKVEFDSESGYYRIPANDGNSFTLALLQANSTGNTKIFLPNGTYDLGETVLTNVSGNNISIVGESMTGTIIKNAPPKEIEGIGTTATILNTSKNLYLQDLTLQNALDYYAKGSDARAVALQDRGDKTICKNVRLLSYQDTYYSNSIADFYWEDSEIHGTVDYVCGDGNVVYNRVKLVNESRKKDVKNGSDVIAAPYNTASTADRFNWGYVFLDCSIESLCSDFTFARSWGGESKAAFINTTIKDNSLASDRWTLKGMNVAASAFKEYNTMDASGNVISPSSKVLTFTHTSGNNTFETILSSSEAAEFTIANIYGSWAPDTKAAQIKAETPSVSGTELTWTAVANATAYAIVKDGEIIDIVPATTTAYTVSGEGEYAIRTANGRGGFGEPTEAAIVTAINDLSAKDNAQVIGVKYFTSDGRETVSPAKGMNIVVKTLSDGKKVTVKEIVK